MKPLTTAALVFFAATCLVSTVVIAADIQENALHSPWLPDPDRTPGAINPNVTQANIHQTICVDGWTKKIRPPASYTNKLKLKQLVEEGLSHTDPKSMEEDHLVSLEIGGAPRDTKNLWPQTYTGKWNAHIKDRLENKLHQLVCSGSITLKTAQDAIRTNWVTAYRQYVLQESTS